MDTVVGGGYSLEDLRAATDAYVARRTKTWLGVCWYKPDITLYLEWDDETLYQVGEVLSCSKAEAEWVLKLLKSSGTHFVFTTYTHEETINEDEEEDEDDDEEFDDDGWLTGFESKKPKKISPRWRTDVVGRSYRYVGSLSDCGLSRQKQTIFRNGDNRVFFPGEEIPITAEYAINISEKYEQKKLYQIRLLLKLQIYYLIAFCKKESP